MIQAVGEIENDASEASILGITARFNELASQITSELENVFAVPVDTAREWLKIESSKEYTKVLNLYMNPGEGGEELASSEESFDYDVNDPVIDGEESEFADDYQDVVTETLYSDQFDEDGNPVDEESGIAGSEYMSDDTESAEDDYYEEDPEDYEDYSEETGASDDSGIAGGYEDSEDGSEYLLD